MIGQGYYKLEPLAYLIDNPFEIILVGSSENTVGKLDVNIIPTDESGWRDPPEEIITDNPEDLINGRIDFVVTVNWAIELPKTFCTDVFCEY